MCGIWGYITKEKVNDKSLLTLTEYFNNIKSRGPDDSTFINLEVNNLHMYLGFHRLAIIDIVGGSQPIIVEKMNRKTILLCNGEIYNYLEIKEKNGFETNSDCHIIVDLYLKYGISETCRQLNGEFAFCLIDIIDNDVNVYMCRDRFGIRPLFITGTDNSVAFCSEMKGIQHFGRCFQVAPRKYSQVITNSEFKISVGEYYKINSNIVSIEKSDAYQKIRDTLYKSVKDRLQSERPLGSLLSGGLDSSLISAIASDILKKQGKILHTFSIGMEGATDLKYAKMVAEHIGSHHTEIILPIDDWINSIKTVIYRTETYDMTTIRASVGQYLIGKYISEHTDIKVLLNGDGSDEVCAGYLYFYKAPNALELHNENIRLLKEIHYYDVLRVDRAISGHGLEARVPFLEHNFVDLYLSFPPEYRKPGNASMEKQLLRDAFKDTGLLPLEVLYRKKEAFSDGVSSVEKSWFQIIEDSIEEIKYKNAQHLEVNGSNEPFTETNYNFMPPITKEGHYFRDIFEEYYPKQEQILDIEHYWLPLWSGNIVNPSARILDVYTTGTLNKS